MPPPLATVQRIFTAACDLQGHARDRYLERECGDDTGLHAAVLALLRSDESASIFGDQQLDVVRATLRSDHAPLPPRIGEFDVIDVLGRDGMGIVYRGRQPNPAREVAIKVLAPPTPAARRRARGSSSRPKHWAACSIGASPRSSPRATGRRPRANSRSWRWSSCAADRCWPGPTRRSRICPRGYAP
jgi:hypothetical protein